MVATRRPVRWEPVINELLVAAGPRPVEPGARPDGNHAGFTDWGMAFRRDTGDDPSRAQSLVVDAMFTAGERDLDALRIRLIRLAGSVAAWVYDIDARSNLPDGPEGAA